MKPIGTYIPIRIPIDELQACVEAYERLLGERCSLRFEWPEAGLELAAIGSLVLIGGTAAALEAATPSRGVCAVDSLEAWRPQLVGAGAVIVRDPRETPTGRNLFARMADGSIFEIMQFDEKRASAVNKARG